MPQERRSRSLKDPQMYDSMRKDGASEEMAARVSNAAARRGRTTVGRKGGRATDYDERTVPELRARAKQLGLTGYSHKKKSELIDLLRNH